MAPVCDVSEECSLLLPTTPFLVLAAYFQDLDFSVPASGL